MEADGGNFGRLNANMFQQLHYDWLYRKVYDNKSYLLEQDSWITMSLAGEEIEEESVFVLLVIIKDLIRVTHRKANLLGNLGSLGAYLSIILTLIGLFRLCIKMKYKNHQGKTVERYFQLTYGEEPKKKKENSCLDCLRWCSEFISLQHEDERRKLGIQISYIAQLEMARKVVKLEIDLQAKDQELEHLKF